MHRGRCCWAYWLPVLHFLSEIWAAHVEAEGGEGALGDAVLHSPLRSERPVDVIGRLVIEGVIDIADVSVGRLCWNNGSLARSEIYRDSSAVGGRCRPLVGVDPNASESSSSGSNARGLHRAAMGGWIGTEVSADRSEGASGTLATLPAG